jgi:hypothetical protein
VSWISEYRAAKRIGLTATTSLEFRSAGVDRDQPAGPDEGPCSLGAGGGAAGEGGGADGGGGAGAGSAGVGLGGGGWVGGGSVGVGVVGVGVGVGVGDVGGGGGGGGEGRAPQAISTCLPPGQNVMTAEPGPLRGA